MSERFTMMFNDVPSYEKYKQEVIQSGGTIVHDLGKVFMGFTASMPPALVQSIKLTRSSNSLDSSGIASFDADSTVTIQ